MNWHPAKASTVSNRTRTRIFRKFKTTVVKLQGDSEKNCFVHSIKLSRVFYFYFYEILVDSTLATRRIGEQKFSCLQFASSGHDVASFFLIWGGTRSLRMPALRPASQAGPMFNPREGTNVVLRDTIRLTWRYV